jgi:hypothetical protein
MSKRSTSHLGMLDASDRVGILSSSYTSQKTSWFLKVLFIKAKIEGHKWCKLKFLKSLTQMVGSN